MTKTKKTYQVDRRAILKKTAVLSGAVVVGSTTAAASERKAGLIEIGTQYSINSSTKFPPETIAICDVNKYRLQNGIVKLYTDVIGQDEIDVIKSNQTVTYSGAFQSLSDPIEYERRNYLNINLAKNLRPDVAIELTEPHQEESIIVENMNDGSIIVKTDDSEEPVRAGEEMVQQFSSRPVTAITHEVTGELVDTELDVPTHKLARKTTVRNEEIDVSREVRVRYYSDLVFKME
ncbi:hypothetical protein [Natronobeatus ordinarius]|uniref:hypothetical protein n=1 Tax=Natronobeatus ordinarius TaxID=2963433 RepID=UPI0020CF3B79|nr:hypothetical protein [Natronobeatus ordinarius]